jgi:hypothetical protein
MTSVLRQEKPSEKVTQNPDRTASQEVRDAIQAKYPLDDGLMVARMVSQRQGTSWYRVNWYRSNSGGLFIDRSRFIAVFRNEEGNLQIDDQTIRTPEKVYTQN